MKSTAKTKNSETTQSSTLTFRRLPPGISHPVDKHVGARLRLRRTLKKISQEKLGAAVGLTFQQIQKYERGANRIGCSRLYKLAEILDVPISFFFDDMSEELCSPLSSNKSVDCVNKTVCTGVGVDPMKRRETLELIKSYYSVSSSRVRYRIFELAKTLAKEIDSDVNFDQTKLAK